MNSQIKPSALADRQETPSPAAFCIADFTCGAQDVSVARTVIEALRKTGVDVAVLPAETGAWEPAGERPVMVLYDCAEAAVYAALGRGKSPVEALDEWMARIQELLPFCRRNRRRAALIEAGCLRRDPAGMLERAYAHLGLERPAALELEPGQAAADPVRMVIASQAVAQSAAVAGLNGELEAQAVPGEAASEDGLEAAVCAAQAYACLVGELSSQQESAAGLAADQDRLELQLLKAQEAGATQARAAALKQNQIELQMEQLRCLQKELEAERCRLTKLEKSEAEAEVLRGRVAALEAARAERDAWLQDKDAQLQALWNSTSWRVTAPLRRVKLALTGAGREE